METDENLKNSGESREEEPNENQNPCKKSRRKTIIPRNLTKKPEKVCQFCDRNFRGKSGYEIHIKRCERFHRFVRGENLNICALCPDTREFSTQGNVFVHLEKSHVTQIGPAKEKKPETKICEYCEDEVPHKV